MAPGIPTPTAACRRQALPLHLSIRELNLKGTTCSCFKALLESGPVHCLHPPTPPPPAVVGLEGKLCRACRLAVAAPHVGSQIWEQSCNRQQDCSSDTSQPVLERSDTGAVCMSRWQIIDMTGMCHSCNAAHKHQATGRPSPPPSEPSDTSMANCDPITEIVMGLLTPRIAAVEMKADDKHQHLLAELASLKAENMRKDAQMEVLTNEHAAMKRRLEQMEQANRSNNIILFNVPEELPGARPIDSVQKMFQKLPAQATPTEMPVACMRIGKPRMGPSARPRPIKAVFSSGDAKHVALKRGKDIRAKGFGIDVDLTPAQQQERNLKRSRFMALKEQGMFPFWKGAKLFYRQDSQVKEDLGPRPPTTPPPPSQPSRSPLAPSPPVQAPSTSAGPSYAVVAGACA